jgi:hypothetical protein
MPKKQTTLSEDERAKRLREAAHDIETSDDPKDFEKAFDKVVVKLPPKKR